MYEPSFPGRTAEEENLDDVPIRTGAEILAALRTIWPRERTNGNEGRWPEMASRIIWYIVVRKNSLVWSVDSQSQASRWRVQGRGGAGVRI